MSASSLVSIASQGSNEPMAATTYEPARHELHALHTLLSAARERCKKLHATLPVSPREDDMLEGRIPQDFPTSVRGTLECVLADALSERLLQSLLEAAEYDLPSASTPAT